MKADTQMLASITMRGDLLPFFSGGKGDIPFDRLWRNMLGPLMNLIQKKFKLF